MRRSLVVLLILAAALVPAVALAGPLSSNPFYHEKCTDISGTFVGSAAPTSYGFDSHVVSLTGQLSGPAVGSKLTAVTVRNIGLDGTIFFTEDGTFDTTALGVLKTSGGGAIGPDGNVVDYLKVVMGGTGFFIATGIANVQAGTISVTYWGNVCKSSYYW